MSVEPFDVKLIGEHRVVFGPDGSRQLVDLFRTSLADRRGELRLAVAAGDHERVQRVGHAIKGLGATAGAQRLSAAGALVERAAPADVAAVVDLVEAAADEASAGIAQAWGFA